MFLHFFNTAQTNTKVIWEESLPYIHWAYCISQVSVFNRKKIFYDFLI